MKVVHRLGCVQMFTVHGLGVKTHERDRDERYRIVGNTGREEPRQLRSWRKPSSAQQQRGLHS